MSAITVDEDLIHYEVLGRGRPVLLVHGWLGSWRYWVPMMQTLQLKFRVYALDLYGFGDSAKNQNRYTFDHQVRLIDEFLRELGLSKIAMIGHGLGAALVTEYASRYPDRVPRLLLAGAPLYNPGGLAERRPAPPTADKLATQETKPALFAPVGSNHGSAPTVMSATAAMRAALAEAARARGQTAPLQLPPELAVPPAAKPTPPPADTPPKSAPTQETIPSRLLINPLTPGAAARPVRNDTLNLTVKPPAHNPLRPLLEEHSLDALLARCFRRSETNFTKLSVDVAKADIRAVRDSAQAFDSARLLDALRLLQTPTVVIHGQDDPLIPMPDEDVWNYVTHDKEHLLMPILLAGVRHFPMLEDERFARLTTDFLEAADLSKLEIKDRWRRRTR